MSVSVTKITNPYSGLNSVLNTEEYGGCMHRSVLNTVLENSCKLRADAEALIFGNVQPVIIRAAAINRLPSGMSC